MPGYSDALNPEEKALLEEWLADTGATDVVPGDLRGEIKDLAERRQIEVDEVLRSLQYNYKERDRIKHGEPAPRKSWTQYRPVILKQFIFYIEQRVDLRDTSLSKQGVAATWVDLTMGRIDVAQRWWNAGLSPLALDVLVALMDQGLSPEDLSVRIGQRTIIELIDRGTSVAWCKQALGWARKSS